MKFLLVFGIVIHIIGCIETTVLEQLNKDDQSSLLLARQLVNVIPSQRYFNQEPFTCLTMIPTNLTASQKQLVYKLNLTFNYKRQNQGSSFKAKNQQNTLKQNQKQKIVDYYEDYDYDKILDLLHGTCVIHETTEFLYEYCHKQKVRQFDDVYTKHRMGKPQFQDIAMGYYDYQSALRSSKSQQDKALKPGNGMYEIKYSENGDLTIFNKLLQNIPDLTEQEKQALKRTISQKLGQELEQDGEKQKSILQKNKNSQKQQLVVKSLPTRSAIYDAENLFTADTINHKQFELNRGNKIIHTNYPLAKTNRYFTKVQIVHEVTCQNIVQGNKSVYVSKAVVVSPFDLLFLGDVDKCDSIKDINFRPIEERPFNTPYYIDRFRVIQDIVYGYVDEYCTNNWDWQSVDSNQDYLSSFSTRKNYLQPGMTLWLQMAVNSSGKVASYHYPFVVQETIAHGVIRLGEKVMERLVMLRGAVDAKNAKDVVWVNSCKVISAEKINTAFYYNQNVILRNNLIKIKQIPKENNIQAEGKKPGDEILCLCKFRKYTDNFLQMHLTLGNKFIESNAANDFYSYFEFFERRSVKTVKDNDKEMYKLCQSLMCYDVVKRQQVDVNVKSEQKQTFKAEQSKNRMFTQITKLTATSKPMADNIDIESQIYVIDVSESGVMKIHARAEDQDYFYLISTSFILKYRKFPNGTKEIIRENSFYENQTAFSYGSWFGSGLFMHKGYMWRGNDRQVFPRMNMKGEQITKIQMISGYGFVRKWDVGKMRFEDSNMIVGVERKIMSHFMVKQFPIYEKLTDIPKDQSTLTKDEIQVTAQKQPNSQDSIKAGQKNEFQSKYKPLNKSVSVRYQYFHGDYCGNPINKHRRTNVNMQCGEPWMKIEQVRQLQPCVYEMTVSTRLLCRQGYKKVVDRIESIKKDEDSRVKLGKGIVCYPKTAWDNVQYVYDVENKDIVYVQK